jgi:hypothetical protein
MQPHIAPLTLFWKIVIALAAAAGAGTCVALGFLFAHFFIANPGTVAVLDRPATDQDAVGVTRTADGEANIENARFLANYDSTAFYVAPGLMKEDFCLVAKGSWEEDTYWELCGKMIDGRDQLIHVQNPDGKGVILAPDQLDHKKLEADGWVTLHDNLMIHPGE